MSEHLIRARYWMDAANRTLDQNAMALATSAVANEMLKHLESQQQETPQSGSPEQPATTASSTTAKRWDAEGFILRTTLESWLSAQATTEYVVGQLFRSAARLGALPDDAQILALAAQARNSTSVSQASKPSADPSQSAAAPSPSASSELVTPDGFASKDCWKCGEVLVPVEGDGFYCGVALCPMTPFSSPASESTQGREGEVKHWSDRCARTDCGLTRNSQIHAERERMLGYHPFEEGTRE